MPDKLQELHWENLVRSIEQGRCTPFLGAGANGGILPLGGEIARRWASKNGYPLDDDWDLARVSQFIALEAGSPMAPKEKIIWELAKGRDAWLKQTDLREFAAEHDHPLAALSRLPFPVFITTNYDDLLFRTLEQCSRDSSAGPAESKRPQTEICLWNRWVRKHGAAKSVFGGSQPYQPSAAAPVVYHLHGHMDIPESLVLTEADYLDFLVNVTRDQNDILPPRIQQAMAAADILFVGYSMADWSFRVLLRGVIDSLTAGQKRGSIAVQLPPQVPDDKRDRVQSYLQKYLGSIGGITVHVYWGDAADFVRDLEERWQQWQA